MATKAPQFELSHVPSNIGFAGSGMRDESKNGDGIQDDRHFHGGMQDINTSA